MRGAVLLRRPPLGSVVRALCRWSGYHHVISAKWSDKALLARVVDLPNGEVDRQFWAAEAVDDLKVVYGETEVRGAVLEHCPVLADRLGWHR